MAYQITDKCISCGSCEPQCPVNAITAGNPYIIKKPYGDPYVIDEDKCIDCGACAKVCPVDAPQPL